MRWKQTTVWIAVPFAGLVCVALGYFFLILDWQGRPICHSAVQIGLRLWMNDDKAGMFPNVGGTSRESLASINERMGPTNWAQHYRYVPGLFQEDPGHLVLMYYDRPTRWTWHGQPPTIFKERAWIIVPVDFAQAGREKKAGQWGECSESIPTAEFKRRLGETLDFVRTNARPNWQTIVAEHTRFLESVER